MKNRDNAKDEQPADDILGAMNAHHHALIYTIPDIVYFKDIQCRNILVNKAFEEFVGLKESEILGKTDDEIFPQDLAVYCRLSDMEVMKTCKPLRIEEEATSKDGKKIYFDTIKSPLFDNHGNLIGVVGISRDITEQKYTERKIGLFKTLINQSNDAIFIINPATSRFLDVNNAACNTLGYSRNELLKSFPNLNFRPRRDWDGYWRLVSFDVGESYRKVRGLLRSILYDFGFRRLQESLYISPLRVETELKSYLESTHLDRFIHVFVSRSLRESRRLYSELWHLDDLNGVYRRILKDFEANHNLPLLRFRFLEAAASDPYLPAELLPDDWLGDYVEKKALEKAK